MSEQRWKIDHDNDVGPDDGGYWEWWTVTDGYREFKCDEEDDAIWLRDVLERTHPAKEG